MNRHIFEGLNEQQLEAVRAVRGPVCILAGAGSGKTTTITRRIAHQVASGAFSAHQVLAVTFTNKAAGQMSTRLAGLGAGSVRARTFHSEALAQHSQLAGATPQIVASKIPLLKGLAQALPAHYRYHPVRELATEIEWAKNRRIPAHRYEDLLGSHRPPIPAGLMAGLYSAYERRKKSAGLTDFEDLLEHTIQMHTGDVPAAQPARRRYSAFTVDEYQDANLLQQTLLECWTGDGDDVCVVGDDYQSIYGFTGASAGYLLGFADRYPNCKTITLMLNYRSTPQILATANRLVPALKGTAKVLESTRPSGAAPSLEAFQSAQDEISWIVARVQELARQGVALEQMAVIYRINARSEPFEEAFAQTGIAYQVADSPFLRRPAARSVLQKLRRSSRSDVADAVQEAAFSVGYLADAAETAGEEATRQADLQRLIRMAAEYPGEGVAGFIADVTRRFSSDEQGRGVQLLTYHRAKGAEYQAVFLPRLEEGELPFALAMEPEELAEERRLFYVGMTRARCFLFLSWAARREGERRSHRRPSPFLAELGAGAAQPARRAYSGRAGAQPAVRAPGTDTVPPKDQPQAQLLSELKRWRRDTAALKKLPAYIIFHDSTLAHIAARKPGSLSELHSIPGIGPAKAQSYGTEVLELLRRVEGR